MVGFAIILLPEVSTMVRDGSLEPAEPGDGAVLDLRGQKEQLTRTVGCPEKLERGMKWGCFYNIREKLCPPLLQSSETPLQNPHLQSCRRHFMLSEATKYS